jgi:transcription elongation factor GreA
MNKPVYLTQEGAEKLRIELEELKGPKRKEISERLRIAIQQGDLKENADYIATKEEQGFVEGRILELEALLADAEIIEEAKTDFVSVGNRVTIQEDDFPEEVFHIVGPNEANPMKGRISNESPIGKALIGNKVGDVVHANTPGGALKLKILKIA